MAKPDLVNGFKEVYANAAATRKAVHEAMAKLEEVQSKLNITMLSMSHHNLKLQDREA